MKNKDVLGSVQKKHLAAELAVGLSKLDGLEGEELNIEI
jgi:hypothetical protein